MQKSYESFRKKDPIEATDHDTNRLTTTSLSDYVKETIKPPAMTVYLRYFNPTDHNLTNSLQETLDVDGNRRNISWENALELEYDRLLRKYICINTNNPSIIPILTIKHDGRCKIRLYCPVNEIYSISLLRLLDRFH